MAFRGSFKKITEENNKVKLILNYSHITDGKRVMHTFYVNLWTTYNLFLLIYFQKVDKLSSP